MSTSIIILMLLICFVLPFVLGEVFSRLLKAKDLAMRISFALLAIFLGLAPFGYRLAMEEPLSGAIKLGIDLAGGTNLVYQVDTEAAEKGEKEINSQSMELLVSAIRRRINKGGVEEVTVRKVGANRVEVIVPGVDADDVEEIKRRITNLGSLKFGILANDYDDTDIKAAAFKLASEEVDVRIGGKVRAQWTNAGRDREGKRKVLKLGGEGRVFNRTVDIPKEDGELGKETVTQYLVRVEDENREVTGEFLTRAYEQIGNDGGKVVGFNFNRTGAHRFQDLTSRNRIRKDGSRRHLAVILNGEIHSAPTLEGVISSSGSISGDFSPKELKELTAVLNAGALDLPLLRDPVNEFSISPLLGIDVREKGKTALIIAAVAVLVFMLVYYWFAGAVANVCLIINIVLVLGAMALIKATFTLPGLAGLVLTIGMAVDANVLIFERIREELAKGSSLRLAIHNGFSRAFTTIVDANVTTLLTAVILFSIGTDQIKGFAVTLFIGIVMGMFSAVFVGRLIFDLFERKRWITSLPMGHLVGKTTFHFMSKKAIAAVVSCVVIIGGLSAVSSRGEENLDIDFTGGSMITFKFEEDPDIDQARSLLAKKFGTNITLERLEIPFGEDGEVDTFFRLRSTNGDVHEVRKEVEGSFASSEYKLQHVTVASTAIAPIAPPKTDDKKAVAKTARPVLNQKEQKYAEGNWFTLKFSDEISVETAKQYLGDAFKKTDPTLDKPMSLLSFKGTVGSGTKAEKGKSKRFSEIQVLTMKEFSAEPIQKALASMETTMQETPIFEGVNTFDTSVAGEMQLNAIFAMLLSLIAIVAYIWFRFESVAFGVAAVAALVHDVLCVVGFVAVASMLSSTGIGTALGFVDFKINLPMVAAFLTIVGYSLNDTIVVFDRIREVRGKSPKLTSDMVDTSLNQTLSRTLLTSITTLIVVLILYVSGGEGIHGFAFCLVAGVIVGTYSSIYVASPVLVWMMAEPTAAQAAVPATAKS